MTSRTIQRNEPNRSSQIGERRIQKLSVVLNKVIPSAPSFLDGAVEEVTQAVSGTTLWGDVEGVGLAVREALANAILHGNRCDPGKDVGICVAVNESCDLIVVIRDSGSGFDPSRLPNPTVGDSVLPARGHGIFLIRQFMDQVEFRFDQGTEVVMRRRRHWLQ